MRPTTDPIARIFCTLFKVWRVFFFTDGANMREIMFHDSVRERGDQRDDAPIMSQSPSCKNKQERIRAHIRTTEYIDLDGDERRGTSCVGVDTGQKKFENMTNGQVTLPGVVDRVDT